MGNLKFALGILLGVLMENKIAMRFATGLLALSLVILIIWLVMVFPLFFGSLFVVLVLGIGTYLVGKTIWDIIEA